MSFPSRNPEYKKDRIENRCVLARKGQLFWSILEPEREQIKDILKLDNRDTQALIGIRHYSVEEGKAKIGLTFLYQYPSKKRKVHSVIFVQ